MNNSAANAPPTRTKSAAIETKKRGNSPRRKQARSAFVPIVREFRAHTQKNQARLWIPVETSLLVRYEFASCSLQTRYIFVAIVLFCGANGIEEIPLDAKFMSSVLVADERTIKNSFDELLSKKLLVERKEREKRIEQTDRQKETGVVSCVEPENLSKTQSENKTDSPPPPPPPPTPTTPTTPTNSNEHLSQFTLEECLRYVEKCRAKGDEIKNAKALATTIYKTGLADAFILATLYPEKLAEEESKTYGEPRKFSDEPCKICFGARMEIIEGKGARACPNCKDERGKSTGYEPEESLAS